MIEQIKRRLRKYKFYQYLHILKARIFNLFYTIKQKKYIHKTIRRKSKVAVLGTPSHTNIGDSAIVLAEIVFLKKFLPQESFVAELSFSELNEYWDTVIACIRANNKLVYCWPGGGNLGDQWFHEELLRRRAVQALPNNQAIVFPQTIFYTDTERGSWEKENSVSVYNAKNNLTLVAREQVSEQIMRSLYPDTEVILTPDIVLSATMEDFGAVPQVRTGVLMCVRSDAEKSVDDSIWTGIEETLDNIHIAHRRTDMYSDIPVTKENRHECVQKKMQEFCGAELVITDRLHGMIFAALTGTPCIVFSNYNHKVKGTYDWISYLEYVRYVESTEEAKELIPELIDMKDCKFDNSPLMPYFDKLAEVVKDKCHE